MLSLLCSVILLAGTLLRAYAAPPPIPRPMELIEGTYEGYSPRTVDPAWAYDTGSYELIYNVYETLVTFDGERMEQYLPNLAVDWSVVELNPPVISPEGLEWFYLWSFRIRQGVPWQDSAYGTMTTADVEYSIERSLVQSGWGSPSWTLCEPLLNVHSLEELGDLTDPSAIALVGRMIDHAVHVNATHLNLYCAYPAPYVPMLQYLCQPYWSIVCKDWINSLGRYTWSGTWGDYTDWINFHDVEVSPLDDPTAVMMGTGPFSLSTIDYTAKCWEAIRFEGWWRTWPCPFPAFGGSKPAGYVNHIKVTWAYDGGALRTAFLANDLDTIYVDPIYRDEVVNQLDIRCYQPLPTMTTIGLHLTADIDEVTWAGPIYAPGIFGPDGIPRDFFSNYDWGKWVRYAFASAIRYADIIASAFNHYAQRLATAVVQWEKFFDKMIPLWLEDLAQAQAYIQDHVPGLWDAGATIHLIVEKNKPYLQNIANAIKASIEAICPRFIVIIDFVSWVINEAAERWYPMFLVEHRADSTHPHDTLIDYYHSVGRLAMMQGYSNPVMDAMIDEAMKVEPTDPTLAQDMYSDIQQLAHDEAYMIAICNPIAEHYEHTSVVGWYYNPLMYSTGIYFANLWKWYYTPHAQQDAIPASLIGNLLPNDVNYDGKVDMKDIGTTVKGFGATYGPPIHPRWHFRCDFNNDRKIDMKDIGGVAKNFGKTSPIWTPAG